MVFAWFGTLAAAGLLTVDMLDVGQGDAILIQAAGKTVLVDAGDRSADTVAQLKKMGVQRIDLAVATHAHADHIGRMEDVIRHFEVGLFLDSGHPHTSVTYANLAAALQSLKIPWEATVRGTEIALGDVATLSVLWPTDSPLKDTRSDLNSNSVVLLLRHGEDDILLTGDAEAPTENGLLAGGIGPIDVLKVAHHGSNHSSTTAFLRATQPTYALISAGQANRYDHPGTDTLRRLLQAGAMIYRTDQSGHLRVVSTGHGVEVLEGSLEEVVAVPLVDPALATSTQVGRKRR